MDHVHERALKIVYQDKKSSFKALVENEKSVTVNVEKLHFS